MATSFVVNKEFFERLAIRERYAGFTFVDPLHRLQVIEGFNREDVIANNGRTGIQTWLWESLGLVDF
ncbi:hypothetical protein DBR37_05770 [Herminiimonas sp. KBW02]|nr:hypothetical protein DBR37_05770 [Herminiimonas sp. KBW02]